MTPLHSAFVHHNGSCSASALWLTWRQVALGTRRPLWWWWGWVELTATKSRDPLPRQCLGLCTESSAPLRTVSWCWEMVEPASQQNPSNARAHCLLLFWNLYPVVTLLLCLLLIVAKIFISVVECHFSFDHESCFGSQCPSTQSHGLRRNDWFHLLSPASILFPLLLNGFHVYALMMCSVARYSFWSPPKIFSAPPDTKASSFQIKLNITKVKARKRCSELLMALQNFNFSHSEVKLYLKDKTCLQENLTKVHLLDSENSNAEAIEESSIRIIRHYVCVFNLIIHSFNW